MTQFYPTLPFLPFLYYKKKFSGPELPPSLDVLVLQKDTSMATASLVSADFTSYKRRKTK